MKINRAFWVGLGLYIIGAVYTVQPDKMTPLEAFALVLAFIGVAVFTLGLIFTLDDAFYKKKVRKHG